MYRESCNVELKSQLTDDVKNEIDAFLNTKGGTIFVSVENDGTVLPVTDAKERDALDLKVGNWIREAFFPIPSDLIRHSFNDDGILVIEIREGSDKPYYLRDKGPRPSGVFKRVGTSTRRATEEEILSMIMESRDYLFEQDVSRQQDLSFKYFFSVCEENGIPYDERHLKTLALLTKTGEYTNLALLLSDQSPVVVKFAKYDRHMNFTAKSEHTGSLLKVLNDVLEHAANYNETSAEISGASFKRKERKSYPGASLREGILNAFAHADYFIRSNIKIEFYDDRVRIVSPGGLYRTTLQDVLDGIQTYRNPGLVRILNKLHLIENFGTGIPRILDAYRGEEKQPIFEPTENFFKLTLFNLNFGTEIINESLNGSLNESLNDFDLALLKIIQKEPGLNSTRLTEKITVSFPETNLRKVRNVLNRRLSQYCEFIGSKKRGGYYLKKKP